MSQKDSDLQKIRKLIEVMKENDLVELEVKHGDDKIHLKRAQEQPPIVTAAPAVAPPTAGESGEAARNSAGVGAEAPKSELVEITSPIVGTFYSAPSPDSESYVEVGSHVEPQTVVCIVEAMKVMNEIKAETSGTIVEVLVSNGQAVEYGQVLFRVKPD